MEEVQQKNPEEIENDKKGFVKWVKEHKDQLALAGVSVAAVIAVILGLKNKDSITNVWLTLKDEIKKGKPLSAKWYEKADLEELKDVRDSVQKAYLNPKLCMEPRGHLWDLLPVIDNAIGKREWAGKEYGFPVKSENGWHLSSD